jgi:hypothetical protein
MGLGLIGLPCIAQSQKASPASDEGGFQLYTDPAQMLDQPLNGKLQGSQGQDEGATIDQSAPLVMSADQIVGILRAEPSAMEAIKEQVAQQTGAEPSSITDDALLARVRQSDSVRVIATQELVARGYSVDQVATTKKTSAAGTSAAPAKAQDQTYENPDNPQVQHKNTPYANLPSLSDLYSQFPPAQQKLHRFGSDAFLIGSGNANELPMDLPVGSEYVLGPGDYLILNLWGSRTARLGRTIDRQGQVELPEVGTVMISGMPIAQAQVAIEKALNTQLPKQRKALLRFLFQRMRRKPLTWVRDTPDPGAIISSNWRVLLNASLSGSLLYLKTRKPKK